LVLYRLDGLPCIFFPKFKRKRAKLSRKKFGFSLFIDVQRFFRAPLPRQRDNERLVPKSFADKRYPLCDRPSAQA